MKGLGWPNPAVRESMIGGELAGTGRIRGAANGAFAKVPACPSVAGVCGLGTPALLPGFMRPPAVREGLAR